MVGVRRSEPTEEAALAGAEPLDPGRYHVLARLLRDPDTRCVLALGGGGLPAICGNMALVGVMEKLGLAGSIEAVWGTSAGACVAASWGSGTPAPRLLDLVEGLDRRGSVDIAWLRLALAFLLLPLGRRLPDYLVTGKRILDVIRRGLAVETFEECPREVRCIACTDDGRAQRVVLRKGPLLRAVHASLAIPGVMRPPEVAPGETGWFDGGLVEGTPLLSPISEHLRRGDRRELVLIATHFGPEAHRRRARGFLARFLQSLHALQELAWEHQLREARAREGVRVLLLRPRLNDPALFDFSRTRRNTCEAWNHYAEKLSDARIALAFGGR